MKRLCQVAVYIMATWVFPAVAQTLATGDTIARTEPKFSTFCPSPIKYAATAYQFLTNAVNLDPWNPTIAAPGTLNSTGGVSWEPSSTPYPGTYTPAETDDAALQALINSSANGSCVEVTVGTSGQDAFVESLSFQPQNSSGQPVSVWIDGGVRIYRTRNLSDYSGSCGQWNADWPGVLSCPKWITPTASGASTANPVVFGGYGILDGRGWSRFTSNATCPTGYSPCSFNTLKVLSYCLHTANGREWPTSGSAQIGCPTGTQTTDTNNVANGPNMFYWSGASHVVMYKITLLNSGQFNVFWGNGANDFLAWGIKGLESGENSNSDFVDPSYQATNASLIYSFCSVGDNCYSAKSNTSKGGGGATANLTILSLQTGSNVGGVTIGYESSAGVNNVLVSGHVGNGGYKVNSPQQVGHGINGASGEGGAVSLVTYEHSCLTNYPIPFQFIGGPGQMTNIAEIDTHILNGSLSGNSGQIKLQGNNSSTLLGMTVNSIIADGALTSSNQDAAVTVGSLGVGSSVYSKLTGTNVTTSANKVPPPTTTAVPCTTSTWQPLIGEMWFSTSTQNNIQALNVPSPATYTLNATVIPATAFPSTKESLFLNQTGSQSAPIAKVEFYDGVTAIPGCSGSNAIQLVHGDEYASCSLTGILAGTHNYTVHYNAAGTDPNYPAPFVWGNPGTSNQLTAMVTGSSPAPATQVGVFIP